MKTYNHLTLWERYHIRACIQSHMNPQRIATELKRDPTTIRRELQRGGGIGAYNPEWAQKRYQHKRSKNVLLIVLKPNYTIYAFNCSKKQDLNLPESVQDCAWSTETT